MSTCTSGVEGISSGILEPQLSQYGALNGRGARTIARIRTYSLFVEIPPNIMQKAKSVKMSYSQN